MASITLPGVVLQEVTTNEMVFPVAWDREEEVAVEGEVETYASGRKVAWSFEGDHRLYNWVFYGITKTEYEKMMSWRGKTLLIRDRHGRRVFGTYFSMQTKDFRDSEYDVSFTYENLTVDAYGGE